MTAGGCGDARHERPCAGSQTRQAELKNKTDDGAYFAELRDKNKPIVLMEFPVGIAAHSVSTRHPQLRRALTQAQVPDMASLVHGEAYRS